MYRALAFVAMVAFCASLILLVLSILRSGTKYDGTLKVSFLLFLVFYLIGNLLP